MDKELIQRITKYLTHELGGDWFLTGGSLVRLEFDETRGTEDLDFVQVRHPDLSPNKSKNELYQWLIGQGLGPEWINDAVEPFVMQIPNWENELVLISKGPKGQVFRPNLTLFVFLKLNRGSEVDLQDIRVVAPQCSEGFDESKFKSWANEEVTARLTKVKSSLA